jgi:glycosyltransferase involved in cell wall biosynthesis
MRVLVSSVSFPSGMSGVQRHALNVIRCLLRTPTISGIHLIIAPWQKNLLRVAELEDDPRLTTHVAEMGRSSLDRNTWYYRELPRLAAELQVDLVHLSYPVPIDRTAFRCPTVVSLHDLYPYEIPLNFGFPQVIFNRLILQQCLRNVDAIACVSDSTRVRLQQYVGNVATKRAVRIYNCVEPPRLCALSSPIPQWAGESFLLCIAQHRRNKNVPLLVQSFGRLLRERRIDPRMQLVIVGIDGPESARIRACIAHEDLGGRIHLLQELSEPELQWCYSRCEVLVAPSKTEGFGLPVVEGLLAGCRVICSDIPALREVAGDQCVFVRLGRDAEKALADAVVASLRKPVGTPIPFPQFSADRLSEQYANLYRELMTAAACSGRGVPFPSVVGTANSERQPL